MQALSAVLFTLTLFLCGAYAGMALFSQIGVLPTMRRLDRQAYVTTWNILDGLMERMMPPYKISLLLVNLASVVCFLVQHREQMAAITATSFVLSVGALVLTLATQVPMNRRIRAFPVSGDENELISLREHTERNFAVRLGMALVAFAVLCFGAVTFPLR